MHLVVLFCLRWIFQPFLRWIFQPFSRWIFQPFSRWIFQPFSRWMFQLFLCLMLRPSLLEASEPGSSYFFPERKSDFVEIQGDELPSLHGRPVELFELLALQDGMLKPIPFQIDERVPTGKGRFAWVLPLGPAGGTIKDDARLDADDELVFMAKDLGLQAGPELKGRISSPAVEIEVTDPINGAKGYVYFGAAAGIPRLSPEDYVDYDADRDYIKTAVYDIGHSEVFPIAHNLNVVKKEAGGEGVDLIDIFKQRLLATAFFGKIKFDKRAKDWTSDISAYKDGPVRVIRRNENHLFLTKRIKSPSLYTQTFYLRDTFWFPGEVNAPFRLSRLITSLDIFLATEFCRNAVGMEFTSNSIRESVLIDGITSPQEQALDRWVDQEWQLVTGSQGTWINRTVLGTGLEAVRRDLFYAEDVLQEDPPEEEPGIIGKLGIALDKIEQLEGGRYSFRSYIHFPEHFKPGDERNILNLLDHPLQTRINNVP